MTWQGICKMINTICATRGARLLTHLKHLRSPQDFSWLRLAFPFHVVCFGQLFVCYPLSFGYCIRFTASDKPFDIFNIILGYMNFKVKCKRISVIGTIVVDGFTTTCAISAYHH